MRIELDKGAPVYVAGHRGLVGSGIHRKLIEKGHTNIITRTHDELDLINQAQVFDFFAEHKPHYVFLAAATIGGIVANNLYRGQFIYENLAIQTNTIHAAHMNQTKKFIYVASSCVYPKLAPQPMTEDCLLTGPLEPTNQPHAVAKLGGIEMCDAYHRQYGFEVVCGMSSNVYGLFDNFSPEAGHVLPAMIWKFHNAKINKLPSVELWGTGTPRREFILSDDLADALYFLAENRHGNPKLINIGLGADIPIKELAETIAKVVGFEGELIWDTSKPDGTPRKLMETSKLTEMGWKPLTSFEDGLATTYAWFQENHATLRA